MLAEVLSTKAIMVVSVVAGGGLGIFLIQKLNEEKTIRELLKNEEILNTEAQYKSDENEQTSEFQEWEKIYGWIYSAGKKEIKKNMFMFMGVDLEEPQEISFDKEQENINKLKQNCKNNLSAEGNYYLDDDFRQKLGNVRNFCTKHDDKWFAKNTNGEWKRL